MTTPTLTEFRHLYEVLFRFDEAGQLQGAHAQYLEGVARDGVIIQARPGPAIPLSAADTDDAGTIRSILGEAATALVTAREAAEAKVGELQEAIEAKAAELQAQAERIAELEASDEGALRAELAAKDANIQALLARVAELGG